MKLRFFHCTEGAATNQPRAKRSAALGYEYALSPSPERALPRGANVPPLQGLVAARRLIPGRRFALPWAGLLQHLWCEKCATSKLAFRALKFFIRIPFGEGRHETVLLEIRHLRGPFPVGRLGHHQRHHRVLPRRLTAGSSSASISSAAPSSSTKSICARTRRPTRSSIRSGHRQRAGRIAQAPHRSQRSLQHHHPSRRRRRAHRDHPAHRRHLPHQKAEEIWNNLLQKMKKEFLKAVTRRESWKSAAARRSNWRTKCRRSSRNRLAGEAVRAPRRLEALAREAPSNTGRSSPTTRRPQGQAWSIAERRSERIHEVRPGKPSPRPRHATTPKTIQNWIRKQAWEETMTLAREKWPFLEPVKEEMELHHPRQRRSARPRSSWPRGMSSARRPWRCCSRSSATNLDPVFTDKDAPDRERRCAPSSMTTTARPSGESASHQRSKWPSGQGGGPERRGRAAHQGPGLEGRQPGVPHPGQQLDDDKAISES